MDNQALIDTLRSKQGSLQALMQSQDGQQLIRQLTREDGGRALQKAALAATCGNTAELAAMINRIMTSREGAELVQRIGDSIQK
ncbi:MAG: hypothetical protein RRY95_05275 [Oscillospiraceae bacterium]